MESNARITSTESVPADTTFVFRVRENATDERKGATDEQKEAILVRLDDGISAWLNYCQHFTHIKLDKGSGATMRDGEILCANHGAYFETDTGLCTFGPCEGAYLTEIEVTTEEGAVYLTDDDYEFVGEGPIETDPTDLASTSNIEY